MSISDDVRKESFLRKKIQVQLDNFFMLLFFVVVVVVVFVENVVVVVVVQNDLFSS